MEDKNQGPIQEVETQKVVEQQSVQTQVNPNAQNQTTQAKKINALCLTSFICSLVGLLVAGLPLGIAALITGGIGIAKYDPNNETARWMGIFGIILGSVDIVAVIIFLATKANTLNTLNTLNNLYR